MGEVFSVILAGAAQAMNVLQNLNKHIAGKRYAARVAEDISIVSLHVCHNGRRIYGLYHIM